MALQKQEASPSGANGAQRPAPLTPAEVQRLQADAKALISEFQQKLQQTLHLFKMKAAKQVANELPGLAAKMLGQFADERQKLAADALAQIKSEIDAARQEAIRGHGEELSAVRENALAAFLSDAKASFEHTLGQSAESLLKQGEGIFQRAEGILQSIESAAEEARSRISDAGGQIESSLSSEHKKRLAELIAAGQNADAATRLIEAATGEATGKLQSIRDQMEAALQAAVQKHLADLTVASANADTALRSVNGAAGEAAAKLWAAAEQIEASLAADSRKRAEEAAAACLSDLAHKAQVSVDGFEEQLEGTLSAFKRKATARIDEDIAKATAGLLERSAGQLQQQTDEVREKLLADLRDSGSGVLEETRRQMKKIEKTTSEVLHEAARTAAEKAVAQAAAEVEDQAQAAISRSAELGVAKIGAAQKALQTQAELSLSDHQRQLAAEAAASLDGVQRKLDGHIEAFRGKIDQHGAEEHERLLAALKEAGAAAVDDARRNLAKIEKSSSEVLQDAARMAAEKAVQTAAKRAEEQAREAVSQAAGEAVAKLGAERKALESQAGTSVKEHQKHLAAEAAASAENARRAMDEQIAVFEQRLQAAAATLEKRILASSEKDFPRVAAELASTAAADIDKRASAAAGDIDKKAAQASKQMEEKILASGAAAMERAGRDAQTEAENTFRAMRESAIEQARGQMQQIFKEAANSSRTQFDSDLEQAARKHKRAAQAQIEEASRAGIERLRTMAPQAAAAPSSGASRGVQYILVLVALIPTVLFVYLAAKPVMRLKPNAPADFVEASPDLAAAHTETAQKLAQAYWDWAAVHLAPDYPFGSQLPDQPPALFDAEGPGFPTGVDADVARARYWQKLRQLWANPQSWQKVEAWNKH